LNYSLSSKVNHCRSEDNDTQQQQKQN
jgi:hypothetical protein